MSDTPTGEPDETTEHGRYSPACKPTGEDELWERGAPEIASGLSVILRQLIDKNRNQPHTDLHARRSTRDAARLDRNVPPVDPTPERGAAPFAQASTEASRKATPRSATP